jgi:hypothetical protein
MTLASPDSLNLNFSNRLVRTRMPGGVGGAQPRAAPYSNQLERKDHIDVWRVLHTRRDIPERMRDTDTP